MKAIQFKKTGYYVGNHDEVTKVLDGAVVYVGQREGNEAIKTFERDNQAFPLQFDDWIVDLNGVILVLDDMQYQALVAETAIAKKQIDDQKQIGQIIHNSIKAVILRDQRQGGLLAKNGFVEGGYTKPPYITEMEHQINALRTSVDTLYASVNALSGGK